MSIAATASRRSRAPGFTRAISPAIAYVAAPATLAIIVFVATVAPVMAADGGSGAQLRLALALPSPSTGGMQQGASQSLITRVVGRACRQCRRICYHDYRKGCHESWCRKQFTLCMRHCWYEYCR